MNFEIEAKRKKNTYFNYIYIGNTMLLKAECWFSWWPGGPENWTQCRWCCLDVPTARI